MPLKFTANQDKGYFQIEFYGKISDEDLIKSYNFFSQKDGFPDIMSLSTLVMQTLLAYPVKR